MHIELSWHGAGEAAKWVAGVMTAVGVIWLSVKAIAPRLRSYAVGHFAAHDMGLEFGPEAGKVVKRLLTELNNHKTISSEMLNVLSEILEVGFYICTADGKCIYISPELEKWFGMSTERARDYGWLEAIKDQQSCHAAWKFSVENNTPYHCEYEFCDVSAKHPVWQKAFTKAAKMHDTPFYVGFVRKQSE